MDDESSVEQRCARIRGRMVWILSQLEGDGTALFTVLVQELQRELTTPGGARFVNETKCLRVSAASLRMLGPQPKFDREGTEAGKLCALGVGIKSTRTRSTIRACGR